MGHDPLFVLVDCQSLCPGRCLPWEFTITYEPENSFDAINHLAPSELLRLSPSISATSKVEHILDAAVLRCISEHRPVGTHSRSA
jgi:hypothetical protein